MYLVAASTCDDLAELRADGALWRRVRRYNLPVQLALGAAERVHPQLRDPAHAAVLSLAPCWGGSAALHDWIERVGARAQSGTLGNLRINPVHTLHAIDNLALSDLALALGNQGYGLGLGSAPGQAWAALELLLERDDAEGLVLAGDHAGPDRLDAGLGVALGFARDARELDGRRARLLAVEREPAPADVHPSASAGLARLLAALRDGPAGPWSYRVPAAEGDGLDAITLRWELA